MKKAPSNATTSIHDIYVLIEVDGQKARGKLKKPATLEINLTTMRMMGNDGCNEFGGNITHNNSDKNELEFGDINATEMYCNELSNKVGNSFYKVKKYKREGTELKLLSKSNAILLVYQKVD